jgi:hypothetical protein
MFVVDSEKFESKPIGTGKVVIDFGWKKTAEGVCVARWIGDDGRKGDLLLSNNDLRRWFKTEELQSIRDREFEAIKEHFSIWLEVNKNIAPEWLKGMCKGISLWRSPTRLYDVIRKWRDERFNGDDEIFKILSTRTEPRSWMKQDLHLFEWLSNQRQKTIAWRDYQYRNFAAMIRKRYGTAIIPKINWAAIQKSASPENEENRHFKFYQRIASPARLITFIKEKVQVIETNAKVFNEEYEKEFDGYSSASDDVEEDLPSPCELLLV